jgi:hypothetical protein
MGGHKEALKVYDEILDSYEQTPDVFISQARCYAECGDYAKAVTTLKKIPDWERNGAALMGMARCYGEMWQHREAIDFYNRVLALPCASSKLRSDASLSLACCYEEMGCYSEAIRHFSVDFIERKVQLSAIRRCERYQHGNFPEVQNDAMTDLFNTLSRTMQTVATASIDFGYSDLLRHAERKMRYQRSVISGKYPGYDQCSVYVETMCKLFSYPPLVQLLNCCEVDTSPLVSDLTKARSVFGHRWDTEWFYSMADCWRRYASYYNHMLAGLDCDDLIVLLRGFDQLLPVELQLSDDSSTECPSTSIPALGGSSLEGSPLIIPVQPPFAVAEEAAAPHDALDAGPAADSRDKLVGAGHRFFVPPLNLVVENTFLKYAPDDDDTKQIRARSCSPGFAGKH